MIRMMQVDAEEVLKIVAGVEVKDSLEGRGTRKRRQCRTVVEKSMLIVQKVW